MRSVTQQYNKFFLTTAEIFAKIINIKGEKRRKEEKLELKGC